MMSPLDYLKNFVRSYFSDPETKEPEPQIKRRFHLIGYMDLDPKQAALNAYHNKFRPPRLGSHWFQTD